MCMSMSIYRPVYNCKGARASLLLSRGMQVFSSISVLTCTSTCLCMYVCLHTCICMYTCSRMYLRPRVGLSIFTCVGTSSGESEEGKRAGLRVQAGSGQSRTACVGSLCVGERTPRPLACLLSHTATHPGNFVSESNKHLRASRCMALHHPRAYTPLQLYTERDLGKSPLCQLCTFRCLYESLCASILQYTALVLLVMFCLSFPSVVSFRA